MSPLVRSFLVMKFHFIKLLSKVHLKIIKFLHKHGAYPDIINIDGYTPLHIVTCFKDSSAKEAANVIPLSKNLNINGRTYSGSRWEPQKN